MIIVEAEQRERPQSRYQYDAARLIHQLKMLQHYLCCRITFYCNIIIVYYS